MEQSLGVRVPSLALCVCRAAPWFEGGSRLAAVFEEQHLCRGIVSVVEAKSAVASLVVLQYAATCAATVHLVNAEMVADVKLAPGFDEEGQPCFSASSVSSAGRSYSM